MLSFISLRVRLGVASRARSLSAFSSSLLQRLTTVFISALLILLSTQFARASDHISIQLLEQSTLPTLSDKSAWVELLPLPGWSGEYLLAQASGSVSIISTDKVTSLLLPEHLNVNGQIVRITAISVHPNFALRDQQGFGTFYLAYSEHRPQDQSATQVKRLNDAMLPNESYYDVVLAEWKVSELERNRIDISSRREIMRIGSDNKDDEIAQLAFNPYIKQWNDNFAELYITLSNKSGHTSQGSDLFQGSVLRIFPQAFGTKPYTIPATNTPINATRDERNANPDENGYSAISFKEAITSNAGRISDIFWSKHNTLAPFIEHTVSGSTYISKIKVGRAWQERQTATQKTVGDSEAPSTTSVVYTGKAIPEFRNQRISLQQTNATWQLLHEDVQVVEQNKNSHSAVKTQTLPSKLPIDSFLSQNIFLSENQDNDLIIFDIASASTYKVVALQHPVDAQIEDTNNQARTDNTVSSPGQSVNELQAPKNNWLIRVILILVLIFSIGSLYYLWRKYAVSKLGKYPLLRSQYARYEISDDETQVFLFNRHRNKAERTILIKDIVSSDIELNKHSIATCNQESIFNEQAEEIATQAFEKEARLKMVDDKERQIRLVLTDKEGHHFAICPYYRKGNQRLTRTKYNVVIEQIMYWQWFISSIIHGHDRPLKPTEEKLTAVIKDEAKGHLHYKNPDDEEDIEALEVSKAETITKDDFQLEMTHKATAREQQNTDTQADIHTGSDSINNPVDEIGKRMAVEVDTRIIEAIDKLVSLKQKGHLTEQEFELAKAKLLQDLVSN